MGFTALSQDSVQWKSLSPRKKHNVPAAALLLCLGLWLLVREAGGLAKTGGASTPNPNSAHIGGILAILQLTGMNFSVQKHLCTRCGF